ncbi:MAG: UDP-N-acetylmuramoyl-L-alanine--D-glutamate ligase [Acidothermus cellulolyticus]|nr:UDP-N-acetylmuramoyl-L-alanine--D-glutamate ligase [Acidothermus cellulolyticus]
MARVSVVPEWLSDAGHDAPWSQLTVCVAGVGISGRAAARVLAALGAQVIAVDDRDGEPERAAAAELARLGVTVRLGDGATFPDGVQLIVTSPGWRRESPLFAAAADRGVPVWGEPELAWRLRRPGDAEWLVITGTDGKTTTTLMLESILRAAGLRTIAAGNIDVPLVEVVNSGYDVLAVELGSFQLHWSPSVAPKAAAVLNVAPDHLDWWGGSFTDYANAKGRAFAHPRTCAIGNLDDPQTVRLLARAPGRRVGFTLHSPRPDQVGVHDGVLLDRAFVPDPARDVVELATVTDIPVPGAHNVANALAAAALARSIGVEPAAIAAGLRTFTPAAHRIATVAEVDGVRFVDDSKATSPHAAAASLTSFDRIVWIAGGLGKDVAFDELVTQVADRLRGVVLLGACRHEIADALRRHAPQVPVIDVGGAETGDVHAVLDAAVAAAVRYAAPGDVVLLAPAAASYDMFRDYRHRGQAFADAVRRYAERRSAAERREAAAQVGPSGPAESAGGSR